MQRDSELITTKFPAIEQATWLRQRFDACPHFMFFLGDAHTSEVQHTRFPFGQRIAYAGFSKNRADWYHSLPELQHTTRGIVTASNKNPKIAAVMVRAFLPWQKQFYKRCVALDKKDLTKLSDAALLAEYNALADVYTKKLNSSPLIDGFALSTDEQIAAEVKAALTAQGLEDMFVEYFEVLTAATFLSFLQEEEIAFLKIVAAIKKKPSMQAKLIAAHQRDWFWMRNNYVKDAILDVTFFEQRLAEYADVDCVKKIAEIKALPTEHAKKKRALLKKLKLPKQLVTMLTITETFNAWQDERKKGTFWATHYFSLLLAEFSRRTGYPLDLLKYAFPPEMGNVLTKKIPFDELKQRFEYCLIVWTLDTYDVTTDPKLIAKLDAIGTGAFSHVTELKGFSAQLGIVRGRVKVVMSVEEIAKVGEGDILVAVMTRPDYIPAMKKAAAFVTDEGGITCHAAIVARELKKPCIVGTKIATKHLKDGDLVEVNANKGIVRKV